MKYQFKTKTTEVMNTSKRVKANGEDFVQAVSLLIVAVFSYWALGKVQVSEAVRSSVYVALVIIGLRGAVELIKFLDKE